MFRKQELEKKDNLFFTNSRSSFCCCGLRFFPSNFPLISSDLLRSTQICSYLFLLMLCTACLNASSCLGSPPWSNIAAIVICRGIVCGWLSLTKDITTTITTATFIVVSICEELGVSTLNYISRMFPSTGLAALKLVVTCQKLAASDYTHSLQHHTN